MDLTTQASVRVRSNRRDARWLCFIAAFVLVPAACGSDDDAAPGGSDAGPDTAGSAGSSAGGDDIGVAGRDGAAPSCAPADAPEVLGIASAQLNEAPPLKPIAGAQLLGDGLSSTLMPQQFGQAGLRWQGDRMFMLTDTGFWDVPAAGPARWYATPTVGVLGVQAADLDGDGDQDLLLLSMEMDLDIGSGDAGEVPASPVVSRLAVWERSGDALTERSEVARSPGLTFPASFDLGDVDGDADLDVVAFEDGAPVAYVNDGSFTFSRTQLGDAAAEYQDKLVALVDYADRNQDGSADMLVVSGEALDVRASVLLGDGEGKLGAPGLATSLIAALVPHGPSGMGFGVADVTADGVADVLVQDPQGTDDAPALKLYVSTDATTIAPAVQLEALGFELADVNADGKTDIVTTRSGRLVALVSAGSGAFETRDLGVDMAMPAVVDYVVDPGRGATPAAVHVLYRLASCSTCAASCSGQCLFDACVGCLSDADCGGARCNALVCVP